MTTRGGTKRDLWRAIEDKNRRIAELSSDRDHERRMLVLYCWWLANDTLPQAQEIRASILAHGVEATLASDPDLADARSHDEVRL